MPSDPHASSTPLSPASHASPAPSAAAQLAQASHALWIATLSLMTAFMQTNAPAHRYLLARRISRNLDTLSGQDCFDAGCRTRFSRLSRRWMARSEEFAPREARRPRAGLLRFLF